MLSKEEKKAIQMIKNQKEEVDDALIAMEIPENYIGKDVEQEYLEWQKNAELVLNLIEKQNKIIYKMADEIYDLGQKQDMRNDNITIWIDKEHILNYFTKLLEEENNEN